LLIVTVGYIKTGDSIYLIDAEGMAMKGNPIKRAYSTELLVLISIVEDTTTTTEVRCQALSAISALVGVPFEEIDGFYIEDLKLNLTYAGENAAAKAK
jgi:hypothetical protein